MKSDKSITFMADGVKVGQRGGLLYKHKCYQCNEEYWLPKYLEMRGTNKYCSRKCANDSGNRKCICEHCGKKFEVYKSYGSKGRFCSRKCGGLAKRRPTGEAKYPREVWSSRIRERDGRCVLCGCQENLHAHHIISVYADNRFATDLNNGIALCVSCHKKTESYGSKVFSLVESSCFTGEGKLIGIGDGKVSFVINTICADKLVHFSNSKKPLKIRIING